MIKTTLKRAASPLLQRMRPGNVALIHFGRSGSTVVTRMLHEHPRVHWASELFAPLYAQSRQEDAARLRGVDSAEAMFSYLRADMRSALHRFYGVEFKPYHYQSFQLSTADFIERLKELGFTHFMFLDRENRLRKVVSTLVANAKNGAYHLKQGESAQLTRVRVDPRKLTVDLIEQSLVEYLDQYDRDAAQILEALDGVNALRLSYEQDVQADPARAYARVCAFLGLTPRPVEARFSRTNPFPLRDIVENYDELTQALRGTPHAWMLDEA